LNSGGLRVQPTARDIIGPVTPESEAAMTRAVSTLGPQGYRDAVAAIDLALAEVKREDEAAGRPYSFDGVSREEVLSLMNQTALADEGATLPDGKPVTVTPEQRELAKKVRRKVRRTVGNDVVLFARGKAVPATIDGAAFIESALELANSQKWNNQKLFKGALQKMVKSVASKEGIDLTKDSERVNDYISRMVVREVRRALSQSANAVGWYDEKVRKALAVVSLIHPELADDKMAQFAFKWALAVTSNGAKVTDNFKAAERAYRFYKENGRLPIDQGTGTPSEAINEAMELFNDLVAKYGIEDVERFMSTKHTVREIRKYTGVKPGGEYVDTILYGASVVGPKIGNGFFANLYGNFEQLTMDRWFMRTIGRLTGTLIIPKPEVVAKRRTQLRRILAVMSDEQRAELFSTIGVKAPKLKLADAVEGQPAEFAMSNDMTDKIADAIKKHVTDKATRNVFNTLFPIGDASALLPILGKAKEGTVREAYGNEIRKIANGLWTAKDGQKEIPDGPAERNRLRAIFADALDELRQDYPDLTMADLQAVIWYPEKRLYDASKTKEKSEGLEYEDGAPDYETAAIELAKGLGVSDTAISAATKGIDDDISAKRAAGAGRVSGGTDAGAAVQVQSARDVGERIAGDRGGVRAIGATTPLEGAPVVAGATGPDPRIVAVAERYAQANGINLRRQAYYATVDEDRAQRIAAAYDAMPHAPTDPAVVEAYQNLIDQTLAQYRALEEAGYQFYFYDETTDPYDGKPWRALRDLRANQRMAVFTTEAGFGTEPLDVSDNPLLADTGLRWAYGTPDGPTRRVLANDLFRAVHDAFGHSMEGAGFRADGEENAWQAHVRLFTGSAVAALTSETRGQNSWLNFGPYGERNRTAAVQDTVFAPQKSGLMPAFTWEEGRVPDMPEPTGPGGGVTPQPSVVSARQPARGIFDVRNPPMESKSKRGGGAIMAVMDSDGVVYYDVDANMHGDVVDSFPGIEDYIIDGGFIKDGKYIMGTSDGGYSAYEGLPEQIAQVREFTKRVNDPSILSARDPGQRRIDLAYGMGRRSGQQAGVARGRQELLPGLMSAEEQVERLQRAREEVRARRKEDRLRERAKRAALAGRMQARIGRIMAAVEAMRQSADEDADTLMRRALREMLRREAAGSRTGYEFARRELTALKREAADAVRLLPANMRGKYLNRIASVRSAVGVLRISDAVVRDLARYEARSSFNRLRRLERRYASPQTGMTNELRDQILPIVRAGMALLGGQRLMQYTDVNDMSQRIAAANQLAAQARGMYEQERENWRADREMRREGYADAAEALAVNISQMPELPPSRLWSEGRTAGMVGALAIKNSDIHTIAALIDGAIDGPIHDMIHRLSAGKDAMYNDRRRIDQQIDGLLRQAGFTGIDDYVQRGAGYGGTAAADVIDVVLGGTARRITIGEAMSLAAMDDTTLALLADENDPEQPGSPITFSRDGGKLPIPVTQQEVLALRGRLSPGQLALIDGLKGLIDTEIRERSFEVAYRINGRMPEAVPGYYPRRRLSDAIAGDTVDVNANPGNVVMTMLDNAGFLQRRVASTSPLVVDDLVRTIDGHVDEGLRLIHMSEPLRHSITVLRSAGVKDAMESRFGSKFNDQMRKVVFNAVGLSGRPTGDLIDRINGNISGALLMLNPKTWFRQLGGIFRLASEFDTGDWAAGSRRSIALAPSQRTAMIDRIEETSGYFFDRHRRSQVGLFAGVIGDPRQNRERIASMLRSLASNLRSAVDEATQGNIQRMLADLSAGRTNALTILRSVDLALRGIDRQVMLAAYMTARQSLSRTDPSMAEDEAHASACVMAEQAFRRTQNVSDPLDDTVFAAEQKFSKGYGRLLFPFSSDPLKGWNQARRATLNPQNAGRTAFAIGANMIWSAAANPLSLGLAAIGTGLAASEDEDDELLKRALMEKQREGAMRRIANELVASAGGYAGIIAGDIYTAYRAMSDGYAPDQTIQLMPLQVANEVIRSASMGDYGAMAGDLAMMAGIPVTMPIESIARDVEKTIATPDSIRKILLARKQSVGLTPAEEQRLREVQAEIRALKALQTQ
jgi:hypothetical protein